MTWIRLDTDFPDHEVSDRLADELGVSSDRAAMALIRVWCQFAEQRPDGMASTVTDASLEKWAHWKGSKGRFAAAFRRLCVHRANEDQPDGKVRGWWRQEKLLAHQERKRHHRKNRHGTGEEPAPVSRPDIAANGDGDGNENELPASSSRNPATIAYHVRCVVALNAGLRENPLIANPREVSSSEQRSVVTWEADGIPIEIAERVIRERAAGYKSTAHSKQPHSLKYFDAAVRKAHELERHPAAGPGFDPFEAAGKALEAKHATR